MFHLLANYFIAICVYVQILRKSTTILILLLDEDRKKLTQEKENWRQEISSQYFLQRNNATRQTSVVGKEDELRTLEIEKSHFMPDLRCHTFGLAKIGAVFAEVI